jgi:protease II
MIKMAMNISSCIFLKLKTGRYEALTNEPENMYGTVVWAPDSKTIYFTARMKGSKKNSSLLYGPGNEKVRTIYEKPRFCNAFRRFKGWKYLLVYEASMFLIPIYI